MNRKTNNYQSNKAWKPISSNGQDQFTNYNRKDKNYYNQNSCYFNLSESSKNKTNNYNNISKQLEKFNTQEVSNRETIQERTNQQKRKNNSLIESQKKELKNIKEDIIYYENKEHKLMDELKSVRTALFNYRNKFQTLEKKIKENEKSLLIENTQQMDVNNKKISPIRSDIVQHENAQKTINNIISNLLIDKKDSIKFQSFDFLFTELEEIVKPQKVEFSKKNNFELNLSFKNLISSDDKKKGIRVILRGCYFDESLTFQNDNLSFVKSFEFITHKKKTPYENSESSSSKLIFPFDITDFCKFDKNIKIIIQFNQKLITKKEFCFGVFLVKKFEYKELLPVIEKNGIIKKKDQEITKKQIEIAFDQEYEVIPNSIKIPLIDPLSKAKIKSPCIGRLCKHVSVFDGFTFLESNSKKFPWYCPICGGPISYNDLFYDQLITDILKKISIDCTSIEFDRSSNFIPIANSTEKNKSFTEEDSKDCITLE